MQGLQRTEARVQDSRDRVLLDRLHADFERIVAWGEDNVPGIEDLPVQTKRMIDIIRSEVEPELDDAFRTMAAATVEVWSGAELSPTYEELVATGTLSRIRSVELRRALSNYARQPSVNERGGVKRRNDMANPAIGKGAIL